MNILIQAHLKRTDIYHDMQEQLTIDPTFLSGQMIRDDTVINH